MCSLCSEKDEINAGCIGVCIKFYNEGVFLEFEYDAYSIDSSFDGDDACMKINYCPLCGVKLLPTTADTQN